MQETAHRRSERTTRGLSAESVVELLRQHTESLHESVERLPFNRALMNGDLSTDRYAGWLAALLPVHRALEERASASDHDAVRSVWSVERCRADLLAEDLDALGWDPDRAPTPLAVDTGAHEVARDLARTIDRAPPHRFLGSLYVLEGASMGGVMIANRLEACAPELAEATGFLTAYGDTTRPMWEAFVDDLNAAVAEPDAMHECLEGARTTFHCIGDLLRALGPESD